MRRILCSILLTAGLMAAESVTYSYDAAGRLTKVIYAGGKTIDCLYDKAGNLLSRVVSRAAAANTKSGPIKPR